VAFQSDSGVIKTFNVGLFVSMCLTFVLGIVTLYSASKGSGTTLYKTQLIWFVLGLGVAASLLLFDSHFLARLAYPFYAVCMVLLTLVLFVGRIGGGSQRWIDLKFFHLQPSEIAKLAIVFTLAKYFSDDETPPPYTLRRLVVPGLLVAPFFLLILLQPDLGTAGVLFLVAASMVFFLKVHWKSLLAVVLAALIAVPLAYQFVLRDYQRDRVKTFLNPGRDAKGSGYNALQCKIAVGSGKLFGKGFLKGTQSQLNFIPEQHTDFIFSVFSEERGFFGALVLLGLYWSYLFYSLRTVSRARGKFEMLLALGFTMIIFWHVFINIGMVIGVLPIVGVGLPFFSYGGSSMLTFMVATGLLLNLSRKKYIF
jgi:rod shape determining protein RodA